MRTGGLVEVIKDGETGLLSEPRDARKLAGNVVRLLTDRGFPVRRRDLVSDDPARIEDTLGQVIADPDLAVALVTGGTGVGRRDHTIDIVRACIDVELEGFGELFRMLSFEEIGAAAMLSRATAGIAIESSGRGDTIIVALPGSPAAVELAATRLVLPQLPHLVWLRGRG